MSLREIDGMYELDLSGSVPVGDFCEDDSERSGSTNVWRLLIR
jgi:hypothetical protein